MLGGRQALVRRHCRRARCYLNVLQTAPWQPPNRNACFLSVGLGALLRLPAPLTPLPKHPMPTLSSWSLSTAPPSATTTPSSARSTSAGGHSWRVCCDSSPLGRARWPWRLSLPYWRCCSGLFPSIQSDKAAGGPGGVLRLTSDKLSPLGGEPLAVAVAVCSSAGGAALGHSAQVCLTIDKIGAHSWRARGC